MNEVELAGQYAEKLELQEERLEVYLSRIRQMKEASYDTLRSKRGLNSPLLSVGPPSPTRRRTTTAAVLTRHLDEEKDREKQTGRVSPEETQRQLRRSNPPTLPSSSTPTVTTPWTKRNVDELLCQAGIPVDAFVVSKSEAEGKGKEKEIRTKGTGASEEPEIPASMSDWDADLLEEESLMQELKRCEEYISSCDAILQRLNEKEKEEAEQGVSRSTEELQQEKELVERFLLWVTENAPSASISTATLPTSTGSASREVAVPPLNLGKLHEGGTKEVGTATLRRSHVGLDVTAVKNYVSTELGNPFSFVKGSKVTILSVDTQGNRYFGKITAPKAFNRGATDWFPIDCVQVNGHGKSQSTQQAQLQQQLPQQTQPRQQVAQPKPTRKALRTSIEPELTKIIEGMSNGEGREKDKKARRKKKACNSLPTSMKREGFFRRSKKRLSLSKKDGERLQLSRALQEHDKKRRKEQKEKAKSLAKGKKELAKRQQKELKKRRTKSGEGLRGSGIQLISLSSGGVSTRAKKEEDGEKEKEVVQEDKLAPKEAVENKDQNKKRSAVWVVGIDGSKESFYALHCCVKFAKRQDKVFIINVIKHNAESDGSGGSVSGSSRRNRRHTYEGPLEKLSEDLPSTPSSDEKKRKLQETYFLADLLLIQAMEAADRGKKKIGKDELALESYMTKARSKEESVGYKLCAEAHKLKADWIVVGAGGQEADKNEAGRSLGGAPVYLTSHAGCAVVVIRDPRAFGGNSALLVENNFVSTPRSLGEKV